MIDEAVDGLARLSLALWPEWRSLPFDRRGQEVLPEGDGQFDSTNRSSRLPVSHNWREAAEVYCKTRRLPLPLGYPAATQVAQLAATLAPADLAIVLSAGCEEAGIHDGDEATVLRAVAEWLAANTRAPVLILISGQTGPGFERLSELVPTVELFDNTLEPYDPSGDAAPGASKIDGEPGTRPVIDFFPITGAPHPLSPGEQKLAERLLADEELGTLFAFNQRITGHHGNQYIVDLLWQSGRLIIEVDSFQVHGNRFAFAQDRHRDYELMAADYRVLRITHDEAVMDTESAVEKVRQLVRLVGRTTHRKHN